MRAVGLLDNHCSSVSIRVAQSSITDRSDLSALSTANLAGATFRSRDPVPTDTTSNLSEPVGQPMRYPSNVACMTACNAGLLNGLTPPSTNSPWTGFSPDLPRLISIFSGSKKRGAAVDDRTTCQSG